METYTPSGSPYSWQLPSVGDKVRLSHLRGIVDGLASALNTSLGGASSLIEAINAAAPLAIPIIARTASHTLALSDAGAQVEVSSGSATTVTVPTDAAVAFPVGSTVLLVQAGAGQVSVAGASGVTVNATPGLKLYGQWSTALLVKRAANLWLLSGDLSA